MSAPRVQRAAPVLLWLPVAFGFVVGALITRPIQFPDESGMIVNARFMAGVGHESQLWFRAGYALLLVPAARWTNTLGELMVGVHLVNAALLGLSLWGLFRWGRLLLPDDRLGAVAAVLVVGFYPFYQYVGHFAMADNLLIPLAVWAPLIVAEHVPVTTARTVAAIAATAAPVAVHGRGLPLTIAALITLAADNRSPLRRRRITVIVAIVTTALVYVASTSVSSFDEASTLAAGNRQTITALLAANFGLRPLAVLPFTLLSQILYLGVATFGLAFVGFGLLIRRATSGTIAWPARCVLLSIVGTAATSALFTNQGTGDLAFYGRYLEAASPVLLLASFAAVFVGLPLWYRGIVPPAAILAVSFLVGVRGTDAFQGRLQRLNVTGISGSIWLTDSLAPVAATVIAVIGVFIVSALAKRSAPAVAGLLIVVAAGQIVFLTMKDLEYISDLEPMDVLDKQVAALDPDCVTLDQTQTRGFWHGEDLIVQHPDIYFPYWRSGRDQEPVPCGDLIISSRNNLARDLPGWRASLVEYESPFWLWASPSYMERSDLTDLGDSPGAPIAGLFADVEVLMVEPSERSDWIVIEAVVHNNSREPFVPLQNLIRVHGATRVGVEWRDPSRPNERLHEPSRFDLPAPLQVDDSIVVRGEAPIAQGEFDPPPGEWLVHLELVQEGVQWAGRHASGSILVTVE